MKAFSGNKACEKLMERENAHLSLEKSTDMRGFLLQTGRPEYLPQQLKERRRSLLCDVMSHTPR